MPQGCLPDPSVFDEGERLWCWRYEGEELWMELKEEIRFRVQSVRFHPMPTPAHVAVKEVRDHPMLFGALHALACKRSRKISLRTPLSCPECANSRGEEVRHSHAVLKSWSKLRGSECMARMPVAASSARPRVRVRLQEEEGDGEPLVGTADRPYAPMEIIGEINAEGLGLLSWWMGEAQAAAGNDGDMEDG